MKKASDGGVPSQGVPPENSTYPVFVMEPEPTEGNSNLYSGTPENKEYLGRLPTTPTPIGTVDLGPVDQKAK
jgi:hypothetical protein